MGAFENERRKWSSDQVLPLEQKTESAREDIGLEVAKEKKTSVSGRIVSMLNIKTAKRWQLSLQVITLRRAAVDLKSSGKNVLMMTKTENTVG